MGAQLFDIDFGVEIRLECAAQGAKAIAREVEDILEVGSVFLGM